MRILILGASGMLGHVLYSELKKSYEVYGTCRNNSWREGLINSVELSSQKKDILNLESIIIDKKIDIIINCVGVIKQKETSKMQSESIEINSLFPHLLASICQSTKSKLIHFSTDCVFSGKKGNYSEGEIADAREIYGLSKYLGEVKDSHALTLRTSIIGHELSSNLSLIDWFLSQEEECFGFHKAIYSGFPTIEIAKILKEEILIPLKNDELKGVFHLSSEPINKFELLSLVAKTYGKKIKITPSEAVVIDRSLNSKLIREKLNFKPRNWDEMVSSMHNHFLTFDQYRKKEYKI